MIKRNSDYLVFDIETAPLKKPDKYVLDYFEEKKWSKKNVSKERETIDKIIEPTLAQVICICVRGDETQSFTGDEKELLGEFWDFMNDAYSVAPKLTLVTFNGLSFDVPFVELRSAILGVENAAQLPKKRYDPWHHFDVRMMLTGWNQYGLGDLFFWSHIFGIPIDKKIITSDRVVDYFLNGKMKEIVIHCEQDVELTDELYLKLTYE